MTALSLLAETSERLAATSKRGEKQRILVATLLACDTADRGLAALFLAGGVRQPKLNVGYAQLPRLRELPGTETSSLTLRALDGTLQSLADTRGSGSSARRMELLASLWSSATSAEQRFIAGLLLGELRQGAVESIVLDAAAAAAQVTPALLRRAFMLSGKLAEVVQLAFEGAEAALTGVSLELFRPVLPMLAEPCSDVQSALEQLSAAAFEYKLDGARVQVHRKGDEVRVYTRTGNEVTGAVPEVVELIQGVAEQELVLDGEVIALRPDGKPLPFQETMRRFGRKLDVDTLRQSLPLSVFFFDCLYCAGRSLLDAPTTERIAILEAAIPQHARIPRLVTSDRAAAESFGAAALAAGHEGVMAKACDAPYAAGKRGANWLKIKRAHTLDLVVIAAEWGSGRRKGFLSNLHLGALNPKTGEFVMLGKTFKGLTDELLQFQTRALQERETHRDSYTVHVRPELVVEIAVSDIQKSPRYPAGLALRLARVKRYRPDKTAEQASTLDEVRALYELYATPQEAEQQL
jgi:DNA ligase-1